MVLNKLMAVALLFLTVSIANAEEWRGRYELSPTQKAMEVAVLSSFLLDYAQTRDIKNHPELEETNPLLGKHPSDVRIRNYFIAASIGHVLITKLLPDEDRKYFQGGTLILESIVIMNNNRIGLQFKF